MDLLKYVRQGYLVYGSESFKAKCDHDSSEKPIMLGEIVLKEKKSEAYLGDVLCSEGLTASVQATIKDRTSKVKGSIYELRSLIEDFRMQAVGGMQSAIDLYESCIVPSLLTNCGTWTEITKKEESLLDDCQDIFCRAVLQVPVSSPKCSLRAVFALTGMRWRVMEAKVLLVLAIRRQEEGGLALEVLEEQMAMGFPGLGQEVRQICLEVGLPEATRMDVKPEEVRKCLKLENLKQQKSKMVGMTKLQELSQSNTRVPQEYVSWTVEECRMAYQLQTKMCDIGQTCQAPTSGTSFVGTSFVGRASHTLPAGWRARPCQRAGVPDPASGLEGQEETQDQLEVFRRYSEVCQGLGPMTTRTRTRYFIRVKNKRSNAVK